MLIKSNWSNGHMYLMSYENVMIYGFQQLPLHCHQKAILKLVFCCCFCCFYSMMARWWCFFTFYSIYFVYRFPSEVITAKCKQNQLNVCDANTYTRMHMCVYVCVCARSFSFLKHMPKRERVNEKEKCRHKCVDSAAYDMKIEKSTYPNRTNTL